MTFDRPRMMAIKLGVVALIAVGIIVALFMPFPGGPVHMKIDMPPGGDPVQTARSAHQVMGAMVWVAWGVGASVVIVILAVAAFVAWRIVRRHRVPDPSDRFT
jgi:H+/gluconate symporter-like permease